MPAQPLPIPSIARLCELWPPDGEAANPLPQTSSNAVTYRPLPKQELFHEMRQTHKAYFGGIGCAKTTAGCYEVQFHMLRNKDIPHVFVIGSPSFPMLRMSSVPAMKAAIPPGMLKGGSWEAAFHGTAWALTWWNNSITLFRSLGGDMADSLRNVQIGGGWIEEASMLKDADAFDRMDGRMRYPVRRPCLWVTTSPRGENWVAKKFILEPGSDVGCVRSKTSDNPYLPRGYEARLRASYSERFARQELDGEIVTPEGSVYGDLEKQLWPSGNVLRCDIDRQRPGILLVDFGRRRPSVLLLQQHQVRNPITGRDHNLDVVVWELQGPGGKAPEDLVVDQWIPTVRSLGVQIRAIHGDPAGDSRNDQTHETSARKVQEALGCRFAPPTQSWQRSKERGEEVVASRICAADKTRSLVWASDGTTDRAGAPRLLAPNSFASLQALQYPERKPGKPAATESLKDGIHDHDADAIRYGMVMLHGRERAERPWEGLRVVGV